MKTVKPNPKAMQEQSSSIMVGMEGARRATGVPTMIDTSGRTASLPPDPEVPEKKPRRRFTAAYKLRILKEYDACTVPGEIGVLLRREGLYHSNINTWLRQRNAGVLHGLTPRKRGRKPEKVNPLAREIARLERENKKLSEKLQQAETIIDVQKKISEILGIAQDNSGKTS